MYIYRSVTCWIKLKYNVQFTVFVEINIGQASSISIIKYVRCKKIEFSNQKIMKGIVGRLKWWTLQDKHMTDVPCWSDVLIIHSDERSIYISLMPFWDHTSKTSILSQENAFKMCSPLKKFIRQNKKKSTISLCCLPGIEICFTGMSFAK